MPGCDLGSDTLFSRHALRWLVWTGHATCTADAEACRPMQPCFKAARTGWPLTSKAFRAVLKWMVVPLGAPAAAAGCVTTAHASSNTATAALIILWAPADRSDAETDGLRKRGVQAR
jgi:hypothetical protein